MKKSIRVSEPSPEIEIVWKFKDIFEDMEGKK